MKIIFLLGFLQGLILAIVLLTKRSEGSSSKLLGILILFLSIQLGLTSESNGIVATIPDLRALAWTLPFLFAPLTYLYVASLLTKDAFHFKHLIHFIPFLLSFIGLIPYFQLDYGLKTDFDITSDGYFFSYAIAFEIFRIIQAIFYSFLIFKLIKKFRHAARLEISNIPLKWVYQFVYASLTSWIIAFLSIVVYFLSVELVINPFNLVYLLTLIFIYILGFKMISNPLTFGFNLGQIDTSANTPNRYVKSGFKSDEQSDHLNVLSAYMETHQPYLESDITINQLAESLHIPKHHFSQLINEQLGQNFFDFINSHRIEHAKKLLTDPSHDHFKILAIAFESGFNSKSTFNSLFKKYTGLTPTKFREEYKSKL